MLSRDDAQVHSAAELDTTTSVAQGAADNIISPTGQIPAHPFAEIFPLLGKEALRELAGDIADCHRGDQTSSGVGSDDELTRCAE
jgi:hypothetical protein